MIELFLLIFCAFFDPSIDCDDDKTGENNKNHPKQTAMLELSAVIAFLFFFMILTILHAAIFYLVVVGTTGVSHKIARKLLIENSFLAAQPE
jgi:hypothetical protein